MFLEIYYCESPLSTRRRPYQGPSQGTVKLYEGSLTALICVSSRMSVSSSGRHFASASDLLALTVALARILALKR